MEESARYQYAVKLECELHTASYRFGEQLDFDPQDPPLHWGVPLRVALIPLTTSLPTVMVPIPPECRPVCHKWIERTASGQLTGVYYRIGFKERSGVRRMKSIDGGTGRMSTVTDRVNF